MLKAPFGKPPRQLARSDKLSDQIIHHKPVMIREWLQNLGELERSRAGQELPIFGAPQWSFAKFAADTAAATAEPHGRHGDGSPTSGRPAKALIPPDR